MSETRKPGYAMYLMRGETCFEDIARRVAAAVMHNNQEPYYHIINTKAFIPSTPILANAGADTDGGNLYLSACNAIEVENTIKGIFDAVTLSALIFKAGGGVGINCSFLSPQGTPLSLRGVASGPVSFLLIFDSVARAIEQGGLRRGAIMVTMDATHADILKYIHIKRQDKEYQNMNITVTIENGPNSVPANVWSAIVSCAELNGEPGVGYLDHINKRNQALDDLGEIRSLNACGEVPMYNLSSCTLGSVNLAKVINKLGDYTALSHIVKLATRFLDRVIDVNTYPDIRIKQSTQKTRDIGIGVMGFNTLLKRFGIEWNSNDALQVADEIAYTMRTAAEQESKLLACRAGAGYLPGKSKRNRVVLAIAPTGHISRVAQTSMSIYPDYVAGLGYTIEQHIEMVATWQNHVDNSISYTLSRRKADVDADRVFRMAYERGISTMSTYTAGSRPDEPMKDTGCKDGKCIL